MKANATSLVGSLYDENDPRRDAGFSLFYMGINIGALLGPLLTGLLQKEVGFHWGFGAAAVGMALGLAQYAAFRGRLPEETHHVANPLPAGRGIAVRRWRGGRRGRPGRRAHLARRHHRRPALANIVIGISLVAAIGYFALILADKQVTGVERSRIFAFIPLFVCNVVFWSLYQQQFTVVTLYADKRLDRNLFGWEMPVSWVQSINPVFIIVLAGVFAAMWTKLGDRQPVTPFKFGAGTALMGVAFFCFLPMPGGENTAPLLGLAGILLVFTLAELLISPVGLSATTKLAPKKFATQMVALYFLSIALGTALAGHARGLLRPGRRVAVLHLDRPRLRRHRRRRDARVEADPQADGRSGLTMLGALGWGALAASSLLVGAVLALVRTWSGPRWSAWCSASAPAP